MFRLVTGHFNTLPALSDNFLYVTYTTEFPLGGPDSRVIRTTPPAISPDDRRSTVMYYLPLYRHGSYYIFVTFR